MSGVETEVPNARGILSSNRDVFERSILTGSEPFSLLICLDATIFLLNRRFAQEFVQNHG